MGFLSTTSNLLAYAKSISKILPGNFRSTIFHRSPAFGVSRPAPAPAPSLFPNLKHDDNKNLMLIVRYALNGSCDHCVISSDNNSLRVVTDNLPNISLLRAENYCPQYKNADYIIRACSNSKWMLLTSQKLPGPPYELLWDPTTDEMKQLPVSAVWPPPSLPRVALSCCWGMGFDPCAPGDYKVVRCYIFEYVDEYQFRSEVWSLRTGLWKEIPYPHDHHLNPYETNALHINGFYYWLCYNYNTSSYAIIQFDFANEKFRPAPILLPQSEKLGKNVKVVLAEFHGSLAAVVYDFFLERRSGTSANEKMWPCFEIWVWNDEWSLVDTFDVFAGAHALVRVLGLYKNDTTLIQDYKGCLLLYDCKTRKLENLGIHSQEQDMQVFPYAKEN